jgi:hypothetical protein
MTVEEMRQLVQEVEDTAPSLEWELLPVSAEIPPGYNAKTYRAKNQSWTITLTAFDMIDPDKPEAERRCEGIGLKGSVILRLPPPLAGALRTRAEQPKVDDETR